MGYTLDRKTGNRFTVFIMNIKTEEENTLISLSEREADLLFLMMAAIPPLQASIIMRRMSDKFRYNIPAEHEEVTEFISDLFYGLKEQRGNEKY